MSGHLRSDAASKFVLWHAFSMIRVLRQKDRLKPNTYKDSKW